MHLSTVLSLSQLPSLEVDYLFPLLIIVRSSEILGVTTPAFFQHLFLSHYFFKDILVIRALEVISQVSTTLFVGSGFDF